MRWILVVFSLAQLADGRGTSRMAGGTLATPGQFPHIVLVVASSVSVSYCTGSILTRTWVLTAAHCVLIPDIPKPLPASALKLYAGLLDYYTWPRPPSTQIVRGKTYVTHPAYRVFNDSTNLELASYNDIALIQTETPFLLSSLVGSIPLARTLPPLGRVRCLVAGYGKSERGSTKSLRYMDVGELASCGAVDEQEVRDLYHGDEYLCGFSRPGSFVKSGDSGAPLQCGDVVVGVNFYVKPLYGDVHVMVAIATSRYLEWIYSHIPLLAKSPSD